MMMRIKALLFATALFAPLQVRAQFYRADGIQILDPAGNPYIAKGMQPSGWLVLESYALRLDEVHNKYLESSTTISANIVKLLAGNETRANEFWKTFTTNYFTKKDVQDWAAMGFNSIRLPFNYRLLSPVNKPGTYLEEGFAVLDMVIQWCKEAGVSVLLDMHSCPGGQNPAGHSDPEMSEWIMDENGQEKEEGFPALYEENAEYFHKTGEGRTPQMNRDRTTEIWKKIAKRYAKEPTILGYELTNEPHFFYDSFNDYDLRAFYMEVVDAIRLVDPNHIVFVEGNWYASSIAGLLPPFDDNMAIAFHRYWSVTDLSDGRVQEYLDAREEHQVPFLLTESGENSNTWIHEIKTLMEDHDIGWYFWGWKKAGQIATANEILMSEDYRYIVDNWRDSEADPERVYQGLMDLAEAVKTENCRLQKGFYESMIDPKFNTESQPYSQGQSIPGLIYAVHYDIGNQGVAYNDKRYKNEGYNGEPWNLGWDYRNDGVDITQTDHREDNPISIGFHLFHNEDGDWLKYTVKIDTPGCFRVKFRVISWSDSTFELRNQDGTLTGEYFLPSTNGNWITVTAEQEFDLFRAKEVLELYIIDTGVDMGWMEFESCTNRGSDGGFGIPTSAPVVTAPTVVASPTEAPSSTPPGQVDHPNNRPESNPGSSSTTTPSASTSNLRPPTNRPKATDLGGVTRGVENCESEANRCGAVYGGLTMHKLNGNGACEEQCAYFVDLRKHMGWSCGPCDSEGN